jgi:hypothetical protein
MFIARNRGANALAALANARAPGPPSTHCRTASASACSQRWCTQRLTPKCCRIERRGSVRSGCAYGRALRKRHRRTLRTDAHAPRRAQSGTYHGAGPPRDGRHALDHGCAAKRLRTTKRGQPRHGDATGAARATDRRRRRGPRAALHTQTNTPTQVCTTRRRCRGAVFAASLPDVCLAVQHVPEGPARAG